MKTGMSGSLGAYAPQGNVNLEPFRQACVCWLEQMAALVAAAKGYASLLCNFNDFQDYGMINLV